MMLYLRSFIFNVFFYVWSAITAIPLALSLLLPIVYAFKFCRFWQWGIEWGLRNIANLHYEIKGQLPDEPVIIASKHQSAWDTMIFNLLCFWPAYVLKKELLLIPIFGWYLRRVRMIPIDRKAGISALKSLVKNAKAALAEGRNVVIFPEGTRTAPGVIAPLHPGVAALYNECGVKVVPVALNSGLFWGRRSFLRKPGTITVEFLEPINPGLDRKSFMKILEERINKIEKTGNR